NRRVAPIHRRVDLPGMSPHRPGNEKENAERRREHDQGLPTRHGASVQSDMLLCPTCGAAYRENGLNCPRDGARLAPAIDLDPRRGSQVGNYRLVDLLGKGGMGVVYSAQHTFIPKRVAIKILDERFAKVPELVTRFFQEAVAAATIGHPNIIVVDDVGELPGGTAYIVMEYVEGRPLDQVIAEDGPMQLGPALH